MISSLAQTLPKSMPFYSARKPNKHSKNSDLLIFRDLFTTRAPTPQPWFTLIWRESSRHFNSQRNVRWDQMARDRATNIGSRKCSDSHWILLHLDVQQSTAAESIEMRLPWFKSTSNTLLARSWASYWTVMQLHIATMCPDHWERTNLVHTNRSEQFMIWNNGSSVFFQSADLNWTKPVTSLT